MADPAPTTFSNHEDRSAERARSELVEQSIVAFGHAASRGRLARFCDGGGDNTQSGRHPETD
jgi:hypothetical protein